MTHRKHRNRLAALALPLLAMVAAGVDSDARAGSDECLAAWEGTCNDICAGSGVALTPCLRECAADYRSCKQACAEAPAPDCSGGDRGCDSGADGCDPAVSVMTTAGLSVVTVNGAGSFKVDGR